MRKKTEPQSIGMELRQSSAPIVVRGGRGVVKVKGAGPVSGRSHAQSKKSDAEKRGRGRVEEGNPSDRDELLALNVLGVQQLRMREGGTKTSGRGLVAKDSGLRSGRECKSDMESGLADVEPGQADVEPGLADTSYLDSSGGEVEEETGGERGEEGMKDGGHGDEQLFSYFSPPKSAGLAHTISVRRPTSHSANLYCETIKARATLFYALATKLQVIVFIVCSMLHKPSRTFLSLSLSLSL